MAWPNGTPKYDLHRHFGGSISPATVAKLLGHKVELSEVARRMVCTGPSRTFKDFLDKFNILNEITWTEKAIELSIFQVVEDLSVDMIDYAEISFSIDKYMADKRWNRPELIKYVSDVFKSACSKWNTSVGLILSLRMEAPREHQLVNASLINRSDVADRLAGIDIVGDESKFDTKFYRPIFKDWRAAGKMTLAHVGETCGEQNVFDAIVHLHAHRVRHGIAAAGNREILAAARDLEVCFDVSLNSNFYAGTVPDMRRHHLPALLRAGCFATLGTDDPVIFNCCLEDEYTIGTSYDLINRRDDIDTLQANSIRFAKGGE